MLPVGIALMVASVAVGVIVLTTLAVTSPAARSAGRRTRTAMALDDGGDDAPAVYSARQSATPYPAGADPYPAYERPACDPAYEAPAYDPAYEAAYDAAYEDAAHEQPAYEDAAHEQPAYEGAEPYPPGKDPSPYPAQQTDTWDGPTEHDGAAYPAEAEQVPRWALALVTLSGVGLVLGLLMVMIASIP